MSILKCFDGQKIKIKMDNSSCKSMKFLIRFLNMTISSNFSYFFFPKLINVFGFSYFFFPKLINVFGLICSFN